MTDDLGITINNNMDHPLQCVFLMKLYLLPWFNF